MNESENNESNNSDKVENSSNNKEQSSGKQVKYDKSDMMNNDFQFKECKPIKNLEDIQTIIDNPPDYIERLQPRVVKGNTVVPNRITDCHVISKHFIPRERIDQRLAPKTLVCHDYKGGYQEDRFLYGDHDQIYGSDYTFYHWSQIDIFVYFSHHFITIPPLCWINIGHRNGVKVLGTLITEFEDGQKICAKFLKDTETMQNFAKSLCQITKIFGFDGWLLNIENPMKETTILKKFVTYFSACIHSDDPENIVIWYDSVTEKGELKWQNELNDSNKCFFDACDGIFLNYVWTEQNLIYSAEAAAHRNVDVYVGIDVFGRNTFGGGQFNCYKAAELIRRYNLSMAIFAPGWTYETLKNPEEKGTFFELFLNRDHAFWRSLWPYLYTHPKTKYFVTDFNLGLSKDHYNIFTQKIQLTRILHPEKLSDIPNYTEMPTLNKICDCTKCVVTGYQNNCLLTNENLRKNIEYIHHLYVCDLVISSKTIIFFLTRNVGKESCKLSITLLVSNQNNSVKKIKLLAQTKEKPLNNCSVLEINPTTNEDINNKLGRKYYTSIYVDQWQPFAYELENISTPCKILEIGGTIEEGNSIYLCAFGIQTNDGEFFQTHY